MKIEDNKIRNRVEDSYPPSNFFEAIANCFKKYASFNGRATKLEYKSFCLFYCTVNTLLVIMLLNTNDEGTFGILFGLFNAIVIVPLAAAGTRRLHDLGKSGWWQLIYLLPFGIFYTSYLCSVEGEGDNEYGKDPERFN